MNTSTKLGDRVVLSTSTGTSTGLRYGVCCFGLLLKRPAGQSLSHRMWRYAMELSSIGQHIDQMKY
eukprot:scaffold21301_cov37-Prasinocladus_malaysianus.AAC.1